ncbi:MAG: T9SS type A sorting domain-containing protein [Chitinispirillales bacterium]|jgi:peptidoglycan/xylan/chitin deacetylase (PgdA/CDA1 family)|nr:T9SS type A sorting domain-containing protein [Chitinispirillales bacterium]
MRKSILAAGAALMIVATAMGARNGTDNYNFPSPWNPAGLPTNDPRIKQYVLYIWDDNGYSGAYGTEYNYDKGSKSGMTGKGIDNSTGKGTVNSWNVSSMGNPEQLSETGPNKNGMAWALHDLAKGGKVTGGGVPMTFNMITGLYVNGSGPWNNRESYLGYYVPNDYDYEVNTPSESKHTKIAVMWGRDYAYKDGGQLQQSNQIYRISKELMENGAEFGNHTIDHMESNSPLPGGSSPFANNGFGKWNNDGFDYYSKDTTVWGLVYDEAKEFGQREGASAQTMGWIMHAGEQIKKDSWKGYIKLSEDILTKTTSGMDDNNGGLGMNPNDIFGFRAPRLEVNSGMFYALKDLEYLYDCGLEEGYEEHRNGANYVWPYTTDNGIINSWTQYSSGERSFVDSMPEGVWEIPVNCVVVPENNRSNVWQHYEDIMKGAGTPVGSGDKEEWLKNGKITAFDFNIWILHGMTSQDWKATMENTLKLRMDGNKAPFHYGAHTNYYTITYDQATLMSGFNQNGWGLSIKNGWNDYKTRQEGMEWFVTHARGKGAEFVTGKQLIDAMKDLVKIGQDKADKGTIDLSSAGGWTFDSEGGSEDVTSSTSIDNLSGSVNIKKDEEYAAFSINFDAGTLSNATHISLDYKQTSASAIRLVLEDQTVREVTLAHRYPMISMDHSDNTNYNGAALRFSGMIPMSAFDFPVDVDRTMNYSAVDVSKIVRIEIAPLAPENNAPVYGEKGTYDTRSNDYAAKFEFRDFKVHSGTPFDYQGNIVEQPTSVIAPVKNNVRTLSLAGVSSNALRLNIGQAGKYDVKIFSVNGRLLQSFGAQSLSSGLNTLRLNNLAKGVYLIKVQGIDTKQQLTKSALVL